MSLNPVTEMSSGHFNPSDATASMAPIARRSFAQSRAVTSGDLSNADKAQRLPSSSLKRSATTTAVPGTLRPRPCAAASNASRRWMPVDRSSGPAMWPMFRCPASWSFCIIIRMPPASSLMTEGIPDPSTMRFAVTMGTSREMRSRCGSIWVTAASMMPSTPRCSSTSNRRASRSGSLSVLTRIEAYPAGSSAASIPRTIGGNRVLVMSGIMTPTVMVRRVLRPAAMRFGRYPMALAVSRIFATTSADSRARAFGDSARETVATCTPVSLATSLIVTLFFTFPPVELQRVIPFFGHDANGCGKKLDRRKVGRYGHAIVCADH